MYGVCVGKIWEAVCDDDDEEEVIEKQAFDQYKLLSTKV